MHVTTETTSGDCISCERLLVVDLFCASRVFLRVLRFSFLSKINTLRGRFSGASVHRVVVVTTETKSGDCISCERLLVVDLFCASRVFLRVLRFSFLSKINTLRGRFSGASDHRVVLVTTETKSGDCISCERLLVVDLFCASRVFLRVLRFSSLSKINTLRGRL